MQTRRFLHQPSRTTINNFVNRQSMSVAQETPAQTEQAQRAPARRNGRWSGYAHLLMARMLELKREPEVVFWVFVFPLLLALGLGIAFRNKPADAVRVAIVAGSE